MLSFAAVDDTGVFHPEADPEASSAPGLLVECSN